MKSPKIVQVIKCDGSGTPVAVLDDCGRIIEWRPDHTSAMRSDGTWAVMEYPELPAYRGRKEP